MCVFYVRIRILRTLVYGFCARCAAFAYVYGFLCALSGFCESIRLIFCDARCGPWFVESLDDPILRVLWFAIVCANARDLLKVSMIWSWGFFDFFPGRAVCYNWTVARIRSLGFRQVLFPTICPWFTVRSYLGGSLLILIEQYIYPGGVLLMCAVLLCGSYKCRYKGYFGCNCEILD